MQYILRRILINIPVLFMVTVIIFLLINMAPGDPVDFFVNEEIGITSEDLDFVRERFGLNDPLPVRYVKWLGQVARGDLGFRFKNGDDVAEVLFVRLQRTLLLMGAALLIGVIVGISLGIFTGLRQYSFWDFSLTGLSFVGISMPAFVAGIFGLYIFSVKLGWFPSGGMRTIGEPKTLADLLYHLALPALTLSLAYIATFMRYTRFSILEVHNEDYVRTAQRQGAAQFLGDAAAHFPQCTAAGDYGGGAEPAHTGGRRALHGDNLQLARHGFPVGRRRGGARLPNGDGHYAGDGDCRAGRKPADRYCVWVR